MDISRLKIHVTGCVCLLGVWGCMGLAYLTYESSHAIEHISYRMGPISYGSSTILGMILTIGVGCFLGLCLYLHWLFFFRKRQQPKK